MAVVMFTTRGTVVAMTSDDFKVRMARDGTIVTIEFGAMPREKRERVQLGTVFDVTVKDTGYDFEFLEN